MSKSGDGGPVRARGLEGRGPVATLGDDGSGHGVKGGANLRPPSSRNARRPFRSHNDALLGTGEMESQALGFGDGVSRDPREKIELRIELGHVDIDGGAVALRVVSLKLGAVTIQPRGGFVSIKPFKAEPC